MGKTEGEDRTIRISNAVLIVIAVVAAVIIALAIFITPKYSKVFAEYRALRSEYKTASDALKAASAERDELTGKLEEFRTLENETEQVQTDVFKAASKLEKDIMDGKSDRRICYITIDDGPYNRANDYFEIFNKYDVKATFFLTTANGNKLPDQADIKADTMYREYLKYGHTIGNHTYSHNYSAGGIYSSTKKFMEAVEKQQNFTSKATNGYRTRIVRFPGGTGMAGNLLPDIEEELRKEGYGWVNWTLDSGDSSGASDLSADKIRDTVLEAADKNDQKIMVVLFHEWSKITVDAMPEIIEGLEQKGYVFLPLFYDSAMVSK